MPLCVRCNLRRGRNERHRNTDHLDSSIGAIPHRKIKLSRPKKMKLIGRVWHNAIINVVLDGWRERRLDMRDSKEEMYA